jgi:WD40 repeat protein
MRFLFFLILPVATAAQQLETVIQRGHELAVLSVALSPDSNYAATGSKDKSAKLWELSTGREVRSFLGHEASVTAIAFSSDGRLLLTGSNDKSIILWDIKTARRIFERETGNFITSVAVDPRNRFIVYGGYNTTGRGDSVVVLDFVSRRIIAKLSVNPDKGLGKGVRIAISPDGKFMATGEDNRRAQLFETSTWKRVGLFEYSEGYCGGCGTVVSFSKDSRSLFVASHRNDLKQYDLTSLAEIRTFENKIENLSGIATSADGKLLALVTAQKLKIYDIKSGGLVSTLESGEKNDYHEGCFSANGKKVLLASDNSTAVIWNVSTRKHEKPLGGFLALQDKGGLNYDPNFYWQSHIAKYVRLKNNITIAADGKSIIRGKFGTKIKRWDIATGKTIMEYQAHIKAVLCQDLNRDGTLLVSGGGDGKIVIWNTSTGDSLIAIQAYREPVFDIHFSADEKFIVSCSWDGTMKIHDSGSGKLVHRFSLDNSAAYSAQFHPSGLYVFTARLDNSLQMWENDTKTVVRNFVGHTDVVCSIESSPDGKLLLTASWDGSIRIWDVSTGLMVKKFTHSRAPAYKAIFSFDGNRIFSAGADRVIQVWDVMTGNVLRRFDGHNAEITSLVISPDSKMLLSHSLDGVTKFWDLQRGEEFFEHIHLGDRDWLVKNRAGYFTGTDGARNYVHFVDGIKTFSVDQFFNDFYRPDLLPRMFLNRGGDDSRGIQGKLKTSPPPILKVAILPQQDNGKAELLVRIQNNGGGVKDLRILHNGKSIPLPGTIRYPAAKDEHVDYKLNVALIGGNNSFTAIAANRDNVESDPRSVEVFIESDTKHSNCHILSVGINEYRNSKLNLNYAKPDAVSFSTVMNASSTSLFRNVFVHTIFDQDATREGILRKMDELAGEIQPEDVFVFYYAGHGSMVDNKFYFIPTENLRLYDQTGLRKDAIEASVLQEKFKNISALKQLIIMDACQSGGSVELLATRGANEEKAIAQLSRSTGIHVLASAGSEQFAAEFAELGHGLFTYVLIKALQGDADGAPKDGKVTIYELKSYIDDQVPEMTRRLKGKPQYPYTFSRGQDFPVVIKQ